MTPRTLPPYARRIRTLLAALVPVWLAALSVPASVQAGEPVLREQIQVHSDLVTLGDLFQNAGQAAGVAVFRSPSVGTEGIVASKRVAAAARQHGLIWRNPGGIQQVVVHRPSRTVGAEEITSLIQRRITEETGVEDEGAIAVRFTPHPRPFVLDARIREPLVIRQFELNASTGAFRAVVGLDATLHKVKNRVYQGRAQETVAVPVPARNVARGATIDERDMRTIRINKRRIPAGSAVDIGEIVGMAAKRALTAGRPVRRSDLERPRLVRRNALVTIVYRGRGLLLKAQGRAQSDGAEGETIAVLNSQSKRTVQARVDAPGVVSIAAARTVAADPVTTAALPRARAATLRSGRPAPRGSHAPSQPSVVGRR